MATTVNVATSRLIALPKHAYLIGIRSYFESIEIMRPLAVKQSVVLIPFAQNFRGKRSCAAGVSTGNSLSPGRTRIFLRFRISCSGKRGLARTFRVLSATA